LLSVILLNAVDAVDLILKLLYRKLVMLRVIML
jgi:hypothetical protein